MSTLSTSVPAVGDAALSDSAGRVRGHCRAGDDRARAYHADMAKIAAVAFTMGLAMLGIGLPDLLPDDAKLWVVIAALVFLVTGVGLWTVSRWTIVRRDQLRLPSPVAELPTPPAKPGAVAHARATDPGARATCEPAERHVRCPIR